MKKILLQDYNKHIYQGKVIFLVSQINTTDFDKKTKRYQIKLN